jgi:hypothetical protein
MGEGYRLSYHPASPRLHRRVTVRPRAQTWAPRQWPAVPTGCLVPQPPNRRVPCPSRPHALRSTLRSIRWQTDGDNGISSTFRLLRPPRLIRCRSKLAVAAGDGARTRSFNLGKVTVRFRIQACPITASRCISAPIFERCPSGVGGRQPPIDFASTQLIWRRQRA